MSPMPLTLSMLINAIWRMAVLAQQDAPVRPPSQWDGWPFSPGFSESLPFMLAKALFIILIIGLAMLLVRLLFGPGGPLSEPWMEEDREAQRQRKLEELERQLLEGEIDRRYYDKRKAKLQGRK